MAKQFIFNERERNDFSDVNCHWHRNKSVDEHYHADYYEIVITTKGSYSHILSGYPHLQNLGEVAIISPYVKHALIPDNNAEHFNISVKTQLFKNLTTHIVAIQNVLKDGFYITKPSPTSFEFILESINKISDTMDVFSVTLTQAVLSVIFLSVMENRLNQSSNDLTRYCYDAVEKINDGSLIQLFPKDVYDIYPVSHTSFIAEFKRITGQTPLEYLSKAKMDFAKKLLISTNLSILEISLEIGYDSVSYFIKKFTSNFGLTPQKYRKKYAQS